MLDGEKNNLDSLTENVHGQLGQAPWRAPSLEIEKKTIEKSAGTFADDQKQFSTFVYT
jgi:hypothetical protein